MTRKKDPVRNRVLFFLLTSLKHSPKNKKIAGIIERNANCLYGANKRMLRLNFDDGKTPAK